MPMMNDDVSGALPAPAPSGGVQGDTTRDPQHVSGVVRTPPEIEPTRATLVKRLIWDIKKSKAHFKADFERMRTDMAIAYEGAAPEWVRKGFYVANVIQSHIRTKVGDLYAKNPRAEWQRRPRMDFALWDGSQEQLMGAMMMAQMGEPNSIQLLLDYKEGMARKTLMTKIGETLKTLYHYSLDEQTPSFKGEMKAAVRRAITTGVAYVSPGYRQVRDDTPELRMRIADMSARLAHLERLASDIEDQVVDPATSGEIEELRLQMQDLQNRPELVLREGLGFDFPQSTRIIPDKRCKRIAAGFPGADWIAEEFLIDAEEIQEIYGIDTKKGGYMPYSRSGEGGGDGAAWASDSAKYGDKKGMCLVWIMQHRRHGLEYHLLDGYKDFLKEPSAPEFEAEGFFRTVPIVLNEIEHEERIFPYSDVYLLRHPQSEINRARQSLKEHRRANRPAHVVSKGALSDDDKAKLSTHAANAIIELDGMTPGDKVADLLQPVPNNPIDPNVYETAGTFEDIMRVGGSQEANLGGTGGDTATESTIAESSRMSNVRSNTDDIDDALSMIARISGQILLQAVPKERVMEIVGPGAVWPEWTIRDVMEEVSLSVRAGSSGRPNKAQDMQNWERVLPFMIQLPGLDPEWVVRETLRRVDDTLDMAEAYKPGLPPISAMGKPQGAGAGAKDPKSGKGGSENSKKPGGAQTPQGAGKTGPNQNAMQGTDLLGGLGAAMGLPGAGAIGGM